MYADTHTVKTALVLNDVEQGLFLGSVEIAAAGLSEGEVAKLTRVVRKVVEHDGRSPMSLRNLRIARRALQKAFLAADVQFAAAIADLAERVSTLCTWLHEVHNDAHTA